MNIKIGENVYNNINNDKTSVAESGVYTQESIKKAGVINASDAAIFNKSDKNGILNAESVEDIQSLASVSDVTLQKNYMTVMAHSMSDEDFAKLREEGHDISDMEPDQIVTISDEIKAEMAKSGQVIAGYNDDLNIEQLQELTGSMAYAEAIKQSFSKEDVPMTEDNVKQAVSAIQMAADFEPLNESTMLYMAENHMEPTIENIYKASHSGAGSEHNGNAAYYSDGSGYIGKVSNENIDSAQIEKALTKIGVTPDEQSVDLSKKLIENNIPLSEKTFDIYKKLNELSFPMSVEDIADKVSMSVKNGKAAMEADLSSKENLMEKAARLVKELDDISDQAIANVADSGEKLNLRNLKAESARLVKITTMQATVSMTSVSASMSQGAISASRMMAEVRLSMTVSSTYVLLKNDIDVDTTDLKLLVDELKEAENRQFESVFGKQFVADKDGIKSLFEETNEKTAAIKNMPVSTVGILATRSSYSLNVVYNEGRIAEARYAAASERYETMGTEVRTDLGDSMKKAFAGVGEMLDEMGIERSELNEKAVRILGYNQMEVNEASIEKVKSEYLKLNNVLDMMKPGKVLSLIREGINPLEISMDELVNKLNKMDDSDNEPKRFSKFLNELDNSKSITSQEREGFIGIYRMIHQIEKNDSASLGTLINAGAEINFRNLLSAVRTRKHAGMDIKIDDNNGAIENLITKGVSISEQIGKAFIKPAEQVENYVSDYYKQENEDVRKAAAFDNQLVQLLENAGEKATSENILAFDKMVNGRSKMYGDIRQIREKYSENTEEAFEDIIDSFTDKESADAAYEKMLDGTREMLDEASLSVTGENHMSELHSMWQMVNTVMMAQNLARHQYYKVPTQIDNELIDMNVMIKSGDKKGVSIAFESAVLGSVSASFNQDGSELAGMILTDNEKAAEMLNGSKQQLMDLFRDNELPVKSLNIMNSRKISLNIFEVSSDNMNIEVNTLSQGRDEEQSTEAISTKAYYSVAKVFIKGVSAIK